jgi:hypothetical protein
MGSPAENGRKQAAVSAKLIEDQAKVESAAAELVRELSLLDKAVTHCDSPRNIALRITSTLLHIGLLLEKLSVEQITIWNQM